MNLNNLFFASIIFAGISCNGTKNATATPGSASATGLVGTYWKLTELNGRAIGEPEEGKRREVYITFTAKENRVAGNAGCNGYGGTYNLGAEGFRLTFSQMIRTQMACDGLTLENEYLGMLEKVDSYYVTGNTLQLNQGRMAPLAKFIGIPGKTIDGGK